MNLNLFVTKVTVGTSCTLVILAALFCVTGCASKKPLPFVYSTPQVAPVGKPALVVSETQDKRANKSKLDKLVDLPKGLDAALVRELNNCGLVRKAEMKTSDASEAEYALQCTLTQLEWEVPDYDRKMGTAFTMGFLTGAIGGLIYGSTGTDVIGRASMRFVVTAREPERVVLDQEYRDVVTERKTKLNCDTPGTYREMAAKALRKVFDQFLADFRALTNPP